MSVIDYILYVLIIIAALEVLFSITNGKEEKVLIIVNNSGEPLSSKLRDMTILDEDNDNDDDNKLDEEKLSNLEFPPIYNLEEIEKCHSLIDEFYSCFTEKNEINEKCQKLLEEKINEFKKCDLIFSSFPSLDNVDDEFDKLFQNEDFNLNFDDIKINLESFDFLKRKDLKVFYDEEDEKEKEEAKKKKESMFEEIFKESSILNNDKDCIEYELSEEDSNNIKCVKYE